MANTNKSDIRHTLECLTGQRPCTSLTVICDAGGHVEYASQEAQHLASDRAFLESLRGAIGAIGRSSSGPLVQTIGVLSARISRFESPGSTLFVVSLTPTHQGIETAMRAVATEAVIAKGRVEQRHDRSGPLLDFVLRSVRSPVFVRDASGVRALNEAARTALETEPGLLQTVRVLPDAFDDGIMKVQRLDADTTMVIRVGDPLAERLAERSIAWSLTSRQRDVLIGLAEALTNKEISRKLGCSLPTVATHISVLLRKAGALTRQELLVALWSGGRGTRKA